MQTVDALTQNVSTALAGTMLIAAGIWLLRLNWLARPNGSWLRVLSGWALVIAGFVCFALQSSAEVGIAYGLLALALAAYAIVALTIERRGNKLRSASSLAAALEPEDRPTNWTRAIAKSLLSIVLAGVAAIGVGVAFAVAMPFGVHDRVVIGGILVPVLWGAGMAWTLADAKILRATLLLLAISATGYAIAFLPKLLPA
ncbi:hypothetical protein DLM45_03720 [Hyphomicrobium methylovorum]|uniref:hypothetical protein n=1 Tax=Hyphomicrobium methylovorum TaxID=84 RepID=UPI0015E643BD|nr:hypothetical protein [Hyphomicrobium methylovorum]MBA2125332.1 hypothetical protein [Hyphomicrobium methylovorum]